MKVVRFGFQWTSVCLLITLCGALLAASVPTTFSYQGHLVDADGVPVSANLNINFALYGVAEGGTPVWQEQHLSVGVVAGFFQVELGEIEHLDDGLFEPPLYLGMTVDGGPELMPRMRLGSVPFSRVAGKLLSCSSGQTNCNGVCADLQSDPLNCGLCGHACPGVESCVSGQCQDCTVQTFYRDDDSDGWGQCGDSIQACEPEGAYTATQCGDCDDSNSEVNPDAPEICDDGIDNSCNGLVDCQDPACPGGGSEGMTLCDGFCRLLDSDVEHCGMCGEACGLDEICELGSCFLPVSCDDGLKNGQETDVDCGGPDCDPCENGQACLIASDCKSNTCVDNVCQPST